MATADAFQLQQLDARDQMVRSAHNTCDCCDLFDAQVRLSACRHSLCDVCLSINTVQCSACARRSKSLLEADSFRPFLSDGDDDPASIAITNPYHHSYHQFAQMPASAESISPCLSVAYTSNNFPVTEMSPCEPNCYPVLKVCNIAWDLTQDDLISFLLPIRVPSQSTLPLVHVLMNRETGKTLPEAYVEFYSASDVTAALAMRNKRILKGRIVSLMPSSQEELMRAIFPNFQGIFHGVDAVPEQSPSQSYFSPGFSYTEDSDSTGNHIVTTTDEDTFLATQLSALGIDINEGTIPNSRKQQRDCTFLKRDEINHLLAVCRNFKLFFSRKCAQRPFENIVTILLKFPWHQKHLIATLQRDHIFEMCKLCVEALQGHLMRSYYHIEETLMERLLKSIIMVPLFTEKQKLLLLNVAQRPCPAGFTSLLSIYEGTPNATATSSPRDEDFPIQPLLFSDDRDTVKLTAPASCHRGSVDMSPTLTNNFTPILASTSPNKQQTDHSTTNTRVTMLEDELTSARWRIRDLEMLLYERDGQQLSNQQKSQDVYSSSNGSLKLLITTPRTENLK